jgi:hypothetical protein
MTDELEHRLVVVDASIPPRFRPADLRVVRAMTGRSLMEMVGGDDDADRMAALAFFAMRRADRDAPTKVLWDAAEQADVEIIRGDDVDPTNADGSTPSPVSATTGIASR